jgi:hypothetical protein
MKFKSSTYDIVAAFLAVAIPVQLAAQKDNEQVHHKYKLYDLGTFGGPGSQVSDGNPPYTKLMNNRGIAVGAADTSILDPYAPNCITDCFVAHGFQFQSDLLTDLGALPGVNTSYPFALNERDVIVGISENGTVDPLTGFPLPATNRSTFQSGRAQSLIQAENSVSNPFVCSSPNAPTKTAIGRPGAMSSEARLNARSSLVIGPQFSSAPKYTVWTVLALTCRC